MLYFFGFRNQLIIICEPLNAYNLIFRIWYFETKLSAKVSGFGRVAGVTVSAGKKKQRGASSTPETIKLRRVRCRADSQRSKHCEGLSRKSSTVRSSLTTAAVLIVVFFCYFFPPLFKAVCFEVPGIRISGAVEKAFVSAC